MKDLVNVVGLNDLLAESGATSADVDFEQVYGELAKSPQKADVAEAIEQRVRAYFSSLKLPDQVTIYDRLLLSLRSKDLVATFNWDPLLVQAYRRNVTVRELPRIVFLHGNVGIGVCIRDRKKGYIGTRCEGCNQPLSATRLLYPVAEKDYSNDPFIESEWSELKRVLEHAYFITIYGYRAPKTDVAARGIMQQVWETNPTRVLAQIEIFDISPEAEVRENWREFLDDLHYGVSSAFDVSWLMQHPRRSCETLAAATLRNDPWPDRPLPRLDSLPGLHEWVRPLVEEEIEHRTNDSAFKVPPKPQGRGM